MPSVSDLSLNVQDAAGLYQQNSVLLQGKNFCITILLENSVFDLQQHCCLLFIIACLLVLTIWVSLGHRLLES